MRSLQSFWMGPRSGLPVTRARARGSAPCVDIAFMYTIDVWPRVDAIRPTAAASAAAVGDGTNAVLLPRAAPAFDAMQISSRTDGGPPRSLAVSVLCCSRGQDGGPVGSPEETTAAQRPCLFAGHVVLCTAEHRVLRNPRPFHGRFSGSARAEGLPRHPCGAWVLSFSLMNRTSDSWPC